MAATTSLTPVTVEQFRGLFTVSGTKRNVPAGYSPDCQNVTFKPGRVQSRPGLSLVTALTFKTIKEYILQDSTSRRLLFLKYAVGSSGSIVKESGSFSYSDCGLNVVQESVAATAVMNSATLFGREYINVANTGTVPDSLPIQYDDSAVTAYAPPGPAAAPAAADGAAGSVSAGVHKFRIFFKTNTGYWTAPGPSVSLTAAGSKKVDVSSIPIGPSAFVVARVIAATPSCSDDYYFIEGSAMVVNNNTSTTATIDFTDATLIAGTPVSISSDPTSDMLANVAIPPQSGVVSYRQRLFWFGGRKSFQRNGDTGPLNLRFCGGFSGSTRPLGWTEKVSGENATTVVGGYGDAVYIQGTAITAQKGCLENDAPAAEWIPPGVSISARVRCRKSASAVGHLYVYFAATGDTATTFPLGALDIDVSTLDSSEMRWVSGEVLTALNNKLDTTHRLRIAAGGKVSNDGLANTDKVYIDAIELYETSQGYGLSDVWVSSPGDPETINGLTGIMQVSPDDGEGVRAAFVLRNNLYFVKDASLHVTQEIDAEPANWPVEEVSSIVGSPSSKGVGIGDEWACIASRAGCFLFDGGAPKCISTPIRDTWNRINWLYGTSIFVVVDATNNRIYIGVPLDSATAVSHILVYDYIDSPQDGNWNPWVTTQNMPTCGAISTRTDGTQMTLFGAQSNLWKLDSSVHSDNTSAAITTYYVLPLVRQEPARDQRGYRTEMQFVDFYAEGSGSLLVTGLAPDFSTSTNIGSGSVTLSSNPAAEHEKSCEVKADAVAMKFSTAVAGSWWALERVVGWITRRTGAGVRGDAA